MISVVTTQTRDTGPTLEGRFKIGKIIGRGPSGVVYAGTDLQTGQPCAVKRLHAHFYVKDVLARVRKDALAAAALGHPAILAPYHIGSEMTGTLFLVCRFVQGESLATRLQRGPLSFTATLAILDPLCAALQMAHDAGIAHGGITPTNIISVSSGRVVLTDFGMCHLRGTPKIKWGGAVGYAAPETLQDGATLCSPRGDVFALGALVYECLTGQRMFTSTSVAAFVGSVQNPPRLGAALARYEHLDAVLEMACAPQADDRFATAAALWRALQASLLDGSEPDSSTSAGSEAAAGEPALISEPPAIAKAAAPMAAADTVNEQSFADLKLDDDLISGTDPMGLPPTSRPPKRSTAKPGTLPTPASLNLGTAKPVLAAEPAHAMPAAKAGEAISALPGTRAPVRAIDLPVGESSADLHPVSLPPPPAVSTPLREAPRNLEPMRANRSGPTGKATAPRAQEAVPASLQNIPASGRTLRPISALPAPPAETASPERTPPPDLALDIDVVAADAASRPSPPADPVAAKPAPRAPQHSPVPLPPVPERTPERSAAAPVQPTPAKDPQPHGLPVSAAAPAAQPVATPPPPVAAPPAPEVVAASPAAAAGRASPAPALSDVATRPMPLVAPPKPVAAPAPAATKPIQTPAGLSQKPLPGVIGGSGRKAADSGDPGEAAFAAPHLEGTAALAAAAASGLRSDQNLAGISDATLKVAGRSTSGTWRGNWQPMFWASIGGAVVGVAMLTMQAWQTHSSRGGSGSAMLSDGPRFDEEAVLQLAQRELVAKNHQAALGAAELVLRRSPDHPRAKRIAEQAAEVMGTSALYGGFLRAADRRDADVAAALYSEIPGESSFRAGAWEPFPQVRSQFMSRHVALASAAQAAGACDVATQQVERIGRVADSDRDSDLQQARQLVARCQSQEGGSDGASARVAAASTSKESKRGKEKEREKDRESAALRDPFEASKASKPAKVAKRTEAASDDGWGTDEEKPRKAKKKKAGDSAAEALGIAPAKSGGSKATSKPTMPGALRNPFGP
jgi:serine/threonine-protein kinase